MNSAFMVRLGYTMALEAREVPAVLGPNGEPTVLVESLTVPMKSSAGVTTASPLSETDTYVLIPSGTGRIAKNATGVADAEFIRFNGPAGPQNSSHPNNGSLDVGLRLHGVAVDGGESWGGYRADHIYQKVVKGAGAILQAYYKDVPGMYGDNSGTLRLDVYKVTATTKVEPLAAFDLSILGAGGKPDGKITQASYVRVLLRGELLGSREDFTYNIAAGATVARVVQDISKSLTDAGWVVDVAADKGSFTVRGKKDDAGKLDPISIAGVGTDAPKDFRPELGTVDVIERWYNRTTKTWDLRNPDE
ncbi:MAG: hypothetical protein ACRC7O_03445 [Fimbriiglobus sp.]